MEENDESHDLLDDKSEASKNEHFCFFLLRSRAKLMESVGISLAASAEGKLLEKLGGRHGWRYLKQGFLSECPHVD